MIQAHTLTKDLRVSEKDHGHATGDIDTYYVTYLGKT